MNNCVELSPSRTRRLVWKNQPKKAARKRWPRGAILKGPSQLSRATPVSVCVNFSAFSHCYCIYFLYIPHRCVNEVLKGVSAFTLSHALWMADLMRNDWNDFLAVLQTERVISQPHEIFAFQNLPQGLLPPQSIRKFPLLKQTDDGDECCSHSSMPYWKKSILFCFVIRFAGPHLLNIGNEIFHAVFLHAAV